MSGFLGWDGYDEAPRLGSCGEDVSISRLACITNPEQVHIGSHVRIDPGVYISGSVEIGDYVHICPAAILLGGAGIHLADNTGVGPGAKVFSTSEDYRHLLFEGWGASHVDARPVTFSPYSCIGAGAIVMPGVTLREGVRIGAQAFVHKSPPEPWTLYLGTPLRRHCPVDREGVLAEAAALGRAGG